MDHTAVWVVSYVAQPRRPDRPFATELCPGHSLLVARRLTFDRRTETSEASRQRLQDLWIGPVSSDPGRREYRHIYHRGGRFLDELRESGELFNPQEGLRLG